MDNNNQNQNNQTVLPASGNDAAAAPPPPASNTPNAGWEPVNTFTNSATSFVENNSSDNSLHNAPSSTMDTGSTTTLPQSGNNTSNTDTSSTEQTQDVDPRPEWQKLDVAPHEVASPFSNNSQQSVDNTINTNQPTQQTDTVPQTPDNPVQSGSTNYPGQIIDQKPAGESDGLPAQDLRKPMVEPVMDMPRPTPPIEPATSVEPAMDTTYQNLGNTSESSFSGTGLTPQNNQNDGSISDSFSTLTENINPSISPDQPQNSATFPEPDLSHTNDIPPASGQINSTGGSLDTPSIPEVENNMTNTLDAAPPVTNDSTTQLSDMQSAESESSLNLNPQTPESIAATTENTGAMEPDSSHAINFAENSIPPSDTNTSVPNEITSPADTAPTLQSVEPPKPSGKKTGYIIAAIGLLMILAVGGIFAFTQLSSDSDTSPAPQPALSTLPTSAPAASTTDPEPVSTIETYTGDGFTFNYPSNESQNITVTGPKENSDNLELAEWFEEMHSEGQAGFPGAATETEEITLASQPAIKVVATANEESSPRFFAIYFATPSDDIYEIKYVGDSSMGVIYSEQFDQIVSSFKLTASSNPSPTPATNSATLN